MCTLLAMAYVCMLLMFWRNWGHVAMGLRIVCNEGGAEEKWEGCSHGVEESV